MEFNTIITAIATLGGLSLVLGIALVLANHRLHVEEDPRLEVVESMLPNTNCGGCGYPGCRPFAEALLAGEVLPGKCTVNDEAGRARIAHYLGISVGREERRVARLACAGGSNVARHHAHYEGPTSCAAATLVAGGGKGCFWGCLGLADCERSCDFDAITMDRHGLPVVEEDRCTACGDCVTACPKDLFSLQPESRRLWVACRSLEEGDGILADCQVACTACGRCAMDAPGYITMQGNLPVIDYTRGPITDEPTRRCPTGAIVWLDPAVGARKGAAARRIVREEAMPDAPT